MYSTVVSDVGTVRSNNQDSAFAGEHLIAICDGMGGHAGGDTASTIAIRSLAHIEQDNVQGDVQIIAHMMETSVMAAHDAIVGKAKRERRLAGMGTTVTSVALVAGYWVLAHIGDSRAYLLHDGRLIHMTSDHSYVQHLIDTGRISEAEARNHPQRNVVMRVLGDFDIDSSPDIAIRKAHPADRWLLCSDGLCGVLEDSTLQEVLSACSDQEECAQQLVSMALRAGSTDNVTAVIADATLALDADAFDLPHQTPLVGGAASASLEPIADIINEPVASAPALREGKKSPAARAAALRNGKNPNEDDNPPEQRVAQPSTVREENGDRTNPDTGEIPVVQKDDGRISADPNDPEVAKAIRNEHIEQRKTKRTGGRRVRNLPLEPNQVLHRRRQRRSGDFPRRADKPVRLPAVARRHRHPYEDERTAAKLAGTACAGHFLRHVRRGGNAYATDQKAAEATAGRSRAEGTRQGKRRIRQQILWYDFRQVVGQIRQIGRRFGKQVRR